MSQDDGVWRHEFLAARLDEIHRDIKACSFSHNDFSPSLQSEILQVVRLLEPTRVLGVEKTRVGGSGDGGYVQVDDITDVVHAFSLGVFDNDNWDLAMAEAGVPVEQFDHSIERAPSTHPLLQFHRKMIGPTGSDGVATLSELVAAHTKSATPDLILKIDIEGCEWDVFDQASDATLMKFTQILCEFHDLSRLHEKAFRARAHRVFQKLAKYFAPVHVHANNCANLWNIANISVPDVLEISYASRSRYAVTETSEIFPTPLDSPNCPHIADIRLGTFRF
jgi:FkbM family methyltransferase